MNGGNVTDRLPNLEADITAVGIFVIFVFTFGDFVFRKVEPILRSWFER